MLRTLQKVKCLRLRGQIRLSGNMNKKVKAPAGYHWMKSGSSYKLMKNPRGGYKPHKGASMMASFKVQMKHASPKKKGK